MKFFDEFLHILILQIALVVMTGIDFIMHTILYEYGLVFSYIWAIPYWNLLTIMFLMFGLIGISGYLVDRKKVSWKKLLLVFVTIQIEYYGGFLDTIYFVIAKLFRGWSFNWSINWWWSPFYRWFGIEWNLQRNVILNIITGICLIIAWVYVLRREVKNG